MLVIVELSAAALAHRPSVERLVATVAEHEVVIVSTHGAIVDGLVSGLRAVLGSHRLVALLVDDQVQPHEREVIEEVLNEGKLPVLLTTQDPAAPELTGWLEADRRIALPAGAAPAGKKARRQRA